MKNGFSVLRFLENQIWLRSQISFAAACTSKDFQKGTWRSEQVTKGAYENRSYDEMIE
jgi:hypothetical protein